MLKELFKVNRAYREAKEQLVEQSARHLEAKTHALVVMLFAGLTVTAWLATLLPGFYEKLYDAFGLYPIIAVFITSYFLFYLGSKIVVKPSAEELLDDTSAFALFSACRRRESRGLISAGLALLHTFVFALYVVDPKWLGVP